MTTSNDLPSYDELQHEQRLKSNWVARRNRFKKYGITFEDYKRMWFAQNGCCAICGRYQTEFKLALAVDHNHKTKIVRGLLCHLCNQGIGLLQENITILDKAKEYLLKHKIEPQA